MLPRNSCSSRSGNEARATAYAESLTELLESLEPDLIQGRDVSVLTEMLDAAAARSFTELAARPDVQADVQHTLGTVYMDLSMFDKAEIMLESAVAIRRDLAPKGDLHLGQALASLGFMHLSTGQGKTAEPYMREAVTMLRAVHDPPAPVSNLAEAEAALSQCLGADATPANLLEVLTLSRQALERCEQNLDVVPHDTFTYCILVRAEAMWVTNDLDKAEAMYRYLLEVRRSFDSEESQGVASAHVVLGRLLKQRGKLEEAREHLEAGLATRKRILGNHHLAVAWPLGQLAHLARVQRRFDDSIALAEECFDIYQRNLGPNHAQTMDAQADLAVAYAGAGMFEVAIDTLADATRRANEHIDPADHIHAYIVEQQTKVEGMIDAKKSQPRSPEM